MTRTKARPPDTSPVPCSVWFGPRVTPAEERDFIDHLVAERGVAVCCWPRDTALVRKLASAGIPRLLLVGPDAIPPDPAPQQAWVRRAAGNDEIHDALVRTRLEATSA